MGDLRISGLATGIDTESIVTDLMKVEQMKVDSVKQDRQIVEWKQEAYRDITNDLRVFKDDYFDYLKPQNNIRSEATFKKFSMSSANENAVLGTANSDAIEGEYRVKVDQLAKSASVLSSDAIGVDSEKKFLADETTGTFKINYKNGDADTISAELEVTADTTISEVVNTINSLDGVKAKYDTTLDKLLIWSEETGVDQQISFDTSDSSYTDILDALHLPTDGDVITGQQAQIDLEINGVTVGENIEVDNNDPTIMGVGFNLKAETTDFVSLTVDKDVDATFDTVKGFVDKYNEIIKNIHGKLSEKVNRDYRPLTDEQREGLDDDQVEKWEAKAKSGLLRNDNMLENMLLDMRRALSDSVAGAGISLAEIGIKTSSDYKDHGKLVMDESKLREKIASDGEKIAKLFTIEEGAYDCNATSTERQERYNNSGLATRIYDILQDNIRTSRDNDGKKGTLLEKAGVKGDITEYKNTLTDQLIQYDDKIDSLLDLMSQREERYYQRFTAMEKAIAEMNNQSSWLSQQFSSM